MPDTGSHAHTPLQRQRYKNKDMDTGSHAHSPPLQRHRSKDTKTNTQTKHDCFLVSKPLLESIASFVKKIEFRND